MKVVVLAGMVVVLMGCATTKTELNEVGYVRLSTRLALIHQCGVTGRMSPALAAKGKELLAEQVISYQFDPQLLEARVMQIIAAHGSPSQEVCNTTAMQIEDRQLQASAAAPAASASRAPTYTTCNRVFTQTFCTTY